MSKKNYVAFYVLWMGEEKNLQEYCNWVAKGLDGYTLGKRRFLVQNTASEEKDQEASKTRNLGPDYTQWRATQDFLV